MKNRWKSLHMKGIFIVLALCLFSSIVHFLISTKWKTVEISKPWKLFEPFKVKRQSCLPSYEGNIPIQTQTKRDVIDLLEKQNIVTSGEEFQGLKIRQFPKYELLFEGRSFQAFSNEDLNVIQESNKFDCEKWGVMTTIFDPPSESLRRFMYRKDWCVVIVGDKGRPLVEV